mmetsp:Transcript_33702/g.70067  ORF Transcript_33702/g.70067 Transcript_33702/m.70067 type:complete len:309 (+) Transcript_33702:1556-2482(+)
MAVQKSNTSGCRQFGCQQSRISFCQSIFDNVLFARGVGNLHHIPNINALIRLGPSGINQVLGVHFQRTENPQGQIGTSQVNAVIFLSRRRIKAAEFVGPTCVQRTRRWLVRIGDTELLLDDVDDIRHQRLLLGLLFLVGTDRGHVQIQGDDSLIRPGVEGHVRLQQDSDATDTLGFQGVTMVGQHFQTSFLGGSDHGLGQPRFRIQKVSFNALNVDQQVFSGSCGGRIKLDGGNVRRTRLCYIFFRDQEGIAHNLGTVRRGRHGAAVAMVRFFGILRQGTLNVMNQGRLQAGHEGTSHDHGQARNIPS